MTDTSIVRVGGACSILAGCLFAFSGFLFIVFQAGRFDWSSIGSISQYLSHVPSASTIWSIINWIAALAAFLSIAGVLAIADVMRPTNTGLVNWLSIIAIIGYSVIAVTNVADYYQIKRLAGGYSRLDLSAQEAVDLVGFGSLDPLLNLRLVTLGPWFLAVGWLCLRRNRLPRAVGYLGVIGGVGGLFVYVMSLAEVEAVVVLGAVVGVVFHPIWLIVTGYFLRVWGGGASRGDHPV